jgi:SAM-dependent methyltransferase
MTGGTPYRDSFFEAMRPGTRRSAEILVPYVVDLVGPRSVVDVGCGHGVWLKVFAEHGVEDVLGVDGEYIDESKLEISAERFMAADLAARLELRRRFDLAVSLEVGEHLPESAAATYVESLVALAPAVLFSAAIPGQGGIHHVNEQWPGYWADHFDRHRYRCIDCFRMRLWELDAMQPWYAQNALLFVSDELLASSRVLRAEHDRNGGRPLALVHPRIWTFPNPLGFLERLRRLGIMTEEEVTSKRLTIAEWRRAQEARHRMKSEEGS